VIQGSFAISICFHDKVYLQLRDVRGRAPCAPGQGALAAAGHWGLQAGPHCDAGPSPRSAAPVAGHASPCVAWPHRLTSSTSARAATVAKVASSAFLFRFSRSFYVRGMPRRAGVAEEALTQLTQLWARACRPLRLKHFSYKLAWKYEGCRAQPAR